jgi:hypothetical protein
MSPTALSSFKAYVGIAADRINGMLTSTISAAATSLPLTNTNGTTGTISSAGSTYTATIVDGALTEATVCTGNFTSGAIACTATTNAHSAYAYVVFQLTASAGPTAYLPLETWTPDDVYEQLYDTASRGSLVSEAGVQQGVRTSTVDFTGAVFPDTYGYILGGIFGSEDYGAGTPSTHAFGVQNTASAANFPSTRYILYSYDAVNTRLFCGRFTETQLTADPKQLLKHATKFTGRASGVVSNPTPTFSVVKPMPSWTGLTTIGGTPVGNTMTFDATLTRAEVEAIPTLSGIQDPWDIFVGALTCKGKTSLVMLDDTQYANYVNASAPSFDVTLTVSTLLILKVHMTSCNYEKVTPKLQGKSYVALDVQYTALANATDATTAGTGLSPTKWTLSNAIASATTYT